MVEKVSAETVNMMMGMVAVKALAEVVEMVRAVLYSTRHVAAAAVVVAILAAAAAAAAGAVAVSAVSAAAAAAVAETGLAVFCLDRHVHPPDVFLSSFLCGPHHLVRLLPGSCHRPKGLKQELGCRRISSRSLTERYPRESPRPTDHSTRNFPFLQNNSHWHEIGGIVHREHVGEIQVDIC